MKSTSDIPAKAIFASEAELCAVFIKQLPAGWTAYPETGGFDILLVRQIDGLQIGVEAKKRLTAEVILQAVEQHMHYTYPGPDFRAALVPYGCAPAPMVALAGLLGITVITMKSKELYQAMTVKRYGFRPRETKFDPKLPVPGDHDWREVWYDCCPSKRVELPAYIPDVAAGSSAPVQLTDWKIKAIKICILLERRGFVTAFDFAHLSIDRRRWHDMGWISHDHESHARGRFVAGKTPLNLRAQHPRNYAEIEADFDTWSAGIKTPEALVQGDLL